MIVEYIKGLGRGGAESLLSARLATLPDYRTQVVNTFPSQAAYSAALADSGAAVVEARSGRIGAAICVVWRTARAVPQGSILISHSPVNGLIIKFMKMFGFLGDKTVIDVIHSSTYHPLVRIVSRALNRFSDHAMLVGTDLVGARTARGFRSTSVVHGGVDLDHMRAWRANQNDFRVTELLRMGLSPEIRLVVMVGSLRFAKNHALALECAQLLPDDVWIVIAGEGPLRSELEAKIARVHLRVHLLGEVPDAWRWIAVSDLMLHTSRYEGLPVVLMEAAALGTPVVATPFHGAREIDSTGSKIAIAPGFDPRVIAALVTETLETSRSTARRENEYWSVGRFAAEFYEEVDRVHNRHI